MENAIAINVASSIKLISHVIWLHDDEILRIEQRKIKELEENSGGESAENVLTAITR